MSARYIMTSIMVFIIADDLINSFGSHIRNYTHAVVALKVHVWCTIVLWVCGMEVEYMCICSTYHQGLVSQ